MKSGRLTVNTTVRYDHQSGPQVTISIELLHNANMCSLLVSIRAGNSAGLSPASEIEDGKSHLTYDRVRLCKYCSLFM